MWKSLATVRARLFSTREESRIVLDELKRRGARSFLLVTSSYHTAQAAPDQFFRVNGWWKTREGGKTVFLEWSKTIATALGI